jgi:ubiquitin carboxyl-terminal hydrolase 8
MSRPTPPLSSLPLAQLQALINADNESVTDRTPKDWFERAVRESELSVLAARKQRKEEMFLCYTKACQYYMHARMHPDFGTVKKNDANWGQRVKDFKEVSCESEWLSDGMLIKQTHEAYLGKAKELKEALKKRDLERDGSVTSLE